MATATVTAWRIRSASHAFLRHVAEQNLGGRPVVATSNASWQCWQDLMRVMDRHRTRHVS
ncbi:hypothetical protein ACIO02_37935 [Streptomyces sp. NPDC087568]|uniref:hypothetical protein n=1 Tax=Streptomyces sp. NPDC087568 TaxID=3365799 RepID=UPI0038295C7B